MAFLGRESSFRFSSHSWSCFFTLFMSDSCEMSRSKQRRHSLHSLVLDVYRWRKTVQKLQYAQSHRVRRPRVATVSDWHNETSSVKTNRITAGKLDSLETTHPQILVIIFFQVVTDKLLLEPNEHIWTQRRCQTNPLCTN